MFLGHRSTNFWVVIMCSSIVVSLKRQSYSMFCVALSLSLSISSCRYFLYLDVTYFLINIICFSLKVVLTASHILSGENQNVGIVSLVVKPVHLRR